MNAPQRLAIPVYKLYGEDSAWPTPELLHVESIAARSALHDWEIRPHRHHDLFQVLYIRHGSARIHLDGRDETTGPPCLIQVAPQCVHGFSFSRDIDGHVVTLPVFALRRFFAPAPGLPDGLAGSRILDPGEDATLPSANTA